MLYSFKNKIRPYAKKFWRENKSNISQKLVKSEAKMKQKLVELGVKIRQFGAIIFLLSKTKDIVI